MRTNTSFQLLTLLALLGGATSAYAQTTLDVLDETILLSNGTPTSGDTSDAEDNFGGRGEWIIGNNNANPRGGLLRFDVSSLSDQINDAGQVVSDVSLILNTADAREEIQPDSETIFDVYLVVNENAGWIEGTQQGSRAGWSGEPGAASLLYLATPEFEPDDALSPELTEEFDEVILWHSGIDNDDVPIPFTIGIDTVETSVGTVSTDEIDGDGYLTIALDANAINNVLPSWLASGEGNAGLFIAPTEGEGQWFFESNEGFEEEAVDMVISFDVGGLVGDFDGSGALDEADVNALINEKNAADPASRFDLTGDGAVDNRDVQLWVKELKGTWIGDANLDGEFNSSDLVTAFTFGKYEANTPATWGEGDWDGNQTFSSADFVAAFSDGGYEQGPVAATAAVPEPSTLALFTCAALFVTNGLRRRR